MPVDTESSSSDETITLYLSRNRKMVKGSTASDANKSPTSEIERKILNSTEPIPIPSGPLHEVAFNGTKGILLNKSEVTDWKGGGVGDEYVLKEYPINLDPDPEVVTKASKNIVQYTQEMFIRYLRPPTPPQPGEIVIQEMANEVTPPAPPVIIRQQPPRPVTPEPIVVREQPPAPPPAIGRKLITISGEKLPPPPRKVIIERLPPLPPKPRPILVERWLPYTPQKRKVIFKG